MIVRKIVAVPLLLISFFSLSLTCADSEKTQINQLADYPNHLTRDGELVILPNHGTVYLGTDFHGKFHHFEQWLKQTALIEKIDSEEDVYGLILGDVVGLLVIVGVQDARRI